MIQSSGFTSGYQSLALISKYRDKTSLVPFTNEDMDTSGLSGKYMTSG